MQKLNNNRRFSDKPSSPSNLISINLNFTDKKIEEEDPINEEVQKLDPSKLDKIDLNSIFSCSLRAKQPYLKLSSTESQKIPILMGLNTKNNENSVKDLSYRSPIDLFCVIDRSGSMAGKKMELVRETLKYMVSILGPDDRLCLIIFDDKVEILTGLQRVTEKNIENFQNEISKIKHRGGTNIYLGLQKAAQVMKARKYKNKVTSLFMLSDGLDGKGNVAQNFSQLIASMGINDVFTLNTFGFGNDHDPELMRNLATVKDGNFYYIEKLDLVDECFVNALGGLFSVVGENLVINIGTQNKPPFSDIRISKVYGSQWKYNEQGNYYTFSLNQLLNGISKEMMLEINVPPIKKKVGDLERNAVLVYAGVEVTSITENKVIKRELELGFTLYNEDEEIPGEAKKIDQEVMKNYLRVQGAEVIQDARKLADQGKFDEGKKLIQKNLKVFEEEEYKSDQKLQLLSNDMKEIEKLCEPKQFEIKGKKFMMQQEMFHVDQRCNNVSRAYEEAYCNFSQKKMLDSLRSKKK